MEGGGGVSIKVPQQPIAVRLFFDLVHIEEQVPEKKTSIFAIFESERNKNKLS